MKVAGFPTSSDIYLEVDGKKVAVVQSYTATVSYTHLLWATACFDGMAFGLCGKTITALRRNLLREVLPLSLIHI